MNKLPFTNFTRQANGSWVSVNYYANENPGPQIRQLPAIVQPAGAGGPSFVYSVALEHSPTGEIVNRVDIVMDDVAAGDVTLLELTFPAIPSWNPTVYLNDGASSNQADWILLPPGGTNPAVTSYTYDAGTDTVSLRMVNTGRTHRVTLKW